MVNAGDAGLGIWFDHLIWQGVPTVSWYCLHPKGLTRFDFSDPSLTAIFGVLTTPSVIALADNGKSFIIAGAFAANANARFLKFPIPTMVGGDTIKFTYAMHTGDWTEQTGPLQASAPNPYGTVESNYTWEVAVHVWPDADPGVTGGAVPAQEVASWYLPTGTNPGQSRQVDEMYYVEWDGNPATRQVTATDRSQVATSLQWNTTVAGDSYYTVYRSAVSFLRAPQTAWPMPPWDALHAVSSFAARIDNYTGTPRDVRIVGNNIRTAWVAGAFPVVYQCWGKRTAMDYP